MDQVAIAILAFAAGFIIGNLSKLELRVLLKRLVDKNDKKDN